MLRQELSGLPRTNEVRLPGQASPVITHPCTALSVATGGIPVIEGATDQCTNQWDHEGHGPLADGSV